MIFNLNHEVRPKSKKAKPLSPCNQLTFDARAPVVSEPAGCISALLWAERLLFDATVTS